MVLIDTSKEISKFDNKSRWDQFEEESVSQITDYYEIATSWAKKVLSHLLCNSKSISYLFQLFFSKVYEARVSRRRLIIVSQGFYRMITNTPDEDTFAINTALRFNVSEFSNGSSVSIISSLNTSDLTERRNNIVATIGDQKKKLYKIDRRYGNRIEK